MTAGSPRGSPIAPKAATAASRQRTSSCASGDRGELRDAGGHPAFGEEPGRTHHDQRIGIRERVEERGVQRSSASPDHAPTARHRWPGAARVPPRRAGAWVISRHGEDAETGERPERRGLDVGIGVAQAGPSDRDAARVSGRDHPPPAEGSGAACVRRVPWQDHRSPNRVWPTSRRIPPGRPRSSPPDRAPARRRTRAAGAGPSSSLVIAVLFVAAVVVLSRWNVNYYALSPGRCLAGDLVHHGSAGPRSPAHRATFSSPTSSSSRSRC